VQRRWLSKHITRIAQGIRANSDIAQGKIACKLEEMLRSEIYYTIKSTIDHYKGEIFRLNSENEKLREDLDGQ
jgi:hypothetical protein